MIAKPNQKVKLDSCEKSFDLCEIKEIVQGSYYTDSTWLYSAIAKPNMYDNQNNETKHLTNLSAPLYVNRKFLFTISLVRSERSKWCDKYERSEKSVISDIWEISKIIDLRYLRNQISDGSDIWEIKYLRSEKSDM